MTYLLAGATGFLGQSLCKYFTEKQSKLRILSRNPRHNLDNFPYPARFIPWDYVKPNLNRDELEASVIIHLAGEPIAGHRWTKRQKQRLYASRIESTKALVKMVLDAPHKPKVFICASAIGFYGDRWHEELTENSEKGDGFLADLCKDWEAACEPLRQAGIRVVHLRTGLVLGNGGGALATLTNLCKAGLLGNLGNGNQWMSWIHIEDWMRALQYCIDTNHIEGPVNLVSPKPIEHKNFLQILASNLRRSLFFAVPAPLAKLAMGEMASLFLDSQKVYPKKLLENGFQFTYKQLDDALKNIFLQQTEAEIFTSQLFIPQSAEKLFAFFTETHHLQKIALPSLQFQLQDSSDRKLFNGAKIAYMIKPYKIPIKGVHVIQSMVENSSFVDIQSKGPFQKWQQQHSLISYPHGTMIQNQILYRMPLGWIGRIFSLLCLQKCLQKQFQYRLHILKSHFAEKFEPMN